MRFLFALPLLCASLAFADDTADRVAIDGVIRTLNEAPQSARLFTADFDGAAELARLTPNAPASNSKFDYSRAGESRPAGLVISHEPFGEASWNPFSLGLPAIVSAPPRFVVKSLRFVGPDVALLDAVQEHYDLLKPTQRIPVLLVLKRETDVWRIASIRALARP